ncbi:maltose ABC transporter permease [Cellulomonas sp. A375-1]|uniref:Maltose/maltodextrin transport system permease protein n=1 Tax=Cellulomonas gelida TaxID=1712 RepID=A0A4Y3KQP4_9CELL|nr:MULTISPECIES: ABC transporter permease subunit [Cellulomonas]KMM45288.1 maltose ABC transporter permease [Cellulomonas sp. A375-1]MCR6706485.1 ABC transporter permease subunit [Cellulomonas sp.]GEA85916.1 sugar ABC transporter permease [Cellulomonas gelida]GGL31064.1 sugar ABC transporter permease [Cellulomonas gelida]
MTTEQSLTAAVVGDEPPPTRRSRQSHARAWDGLGFGFLAKLALMALVNALGVAAGWSAYVNGAWVLLGVMVGLLVVADWVYFSRRPVPLKYLFPGLAFLAAFQLFTIGYTGYVALTNYGTGHNVTQAQAVDALLSQNEKKVPDSPTYPLTIVEQDGELGFAIVQDGAAAVGTADQPLAAAPDATVADGVVTAVPGWQVVPKNQVLSDPALADEVLALRVPISDTAEDGSIRTGDATIGSVYRSVLVYDEAADTLTDAETGVVYRATDDGQFVAEDGTALPVGWRVFVGFENFTKAFTDDTYAGPLLKIALWTFVFAFASVVVSFFFGLVLALVYNDPRVRGRRVLRTLFILPYAFPAFLSALLWRGMLNANPDYGIVNQLFFFGARIEWLDDPTLAKVSVILVNLWLSYPYWFLVCTGALQSLPGDVQEAARIDGAGRWRTFQSITMPLLLVSTAPLLIASFAFNFNNFTLIYMLTGGGPRFTDTSATLGHTDILISMVYQISGVAGGRADYGLASALSIIIFVIIGVISALMFRRTRQLEEVN